MAATAGLAGQRAALARSPPAFGPTARARAVRRVSTPFPGRARPDRLSGLAASATAPRDAEPAPPPPAAAAVLAAAVHIGQASSEREDKGGKGFGGRASCSRRAHRPPVSLQALIRFAHALFAATAATAVSAVAAVAVAPAVAVSLPAGFRAALAACDDAGRSLDDKWRGLLAWLDGGVSGGRGSGGAPPAAGSPAAAARALFAATAAGAPPAAVQAAEDDMRASVFAALLADG